tara:strand:- start:524 stop:766 length:243 start_codon:yes stop_codon:yes gene_type:complete
MKCYIKHDRDGCIGCGACAAIDPENWTMNEDGKSDLKDNKKVDNQQQKIIDENDLTKHIETAESCPVNVIHVYKEDKKII